MHVCVRVLRAKLRLVRQIAVQEAFARMEIVYATKSGQELVVKVQIYLLRFFKIVYLFILISDLS